jgi:hypothetical protein
MKEYIEREAVLSVIEYIRTKYIENYNRKSKGNQFWSDTIRYFAKKTRAIPTADVAEVRHGEWEETDWVEYDGHGECIHYPKQGLRCPSCCHVFKKELLYKDNFCPNCGADMRGKGDTE